MATVSHRETWMELDEVGGSYPPYRPTFPEFGEFINESHRSYSTCPRAHDAANSIIDLGIPGWLLRDDALKLYEMAYCTPGDILELGTHQGLSTTIMAGAVADAGGSKKIHSVELQDRFIKEAEWYLAERELGEHVRLHCDDATVFCNRLIDQGKLFTFAFIDHCLEYEPTRSICEILHRLLPPGSFCLFHDFNNPKNADPDNRNVGVYQAVADALPRDVFKFFGIYGCTALYRRN